MAQTSSGAGLLLILFLLLAIVACILLIAPNNHSKEKHSDASWLFSKPLSEAKCYENGQRKLFLFDLRKECDNGDLGGGIFTTPDGATVTGFLARWDYWMKVLSRDGYQ